MERLGLMLSFVAVVLAASLATSCGATTQGQGQLQSIAVSPAEADGQAQFIATGYYVNPSHTVTPLPANWTACQENTPTTEASVTSAGVAQCASGATGTFVINAWDSGDKTCLLVNACGTACTVYGSAQLTCP